MAASQGFWSYVHKDDEAEGSRITQLAQDLTAEYELQTGETLQLFLDTTSIEWGNDWRKVIEEGLATVVCFIPVLTPRYFMSAECRRELGTFVQAATSLGLRELVLPVYYVDVPALHSEEPTDALVATVGKYQWEDWRTLRLEDRSSDLYRKGVAGLAARLVAINMTLEASRAAATTPPSDAMSPIDDKEGPGLLELALAAEELLPKVAPALNAIAETISELNRVVEQATNDIHERDRRSTKRLATRLIVAKQLAQQLMPLADTIVTHGSAFAEHLYGADVAVRGMIASFPQMYLASPEAQADVCDAAKHIRSLASKSRQSSTSLSRMLDSANPLTKLSRDLRLPIRRLREGLTTVTEAMQVTGEWEQLIEGLGLHCDDEPSGPGLPAPS